MIDFTGATRKQLLSRSNVSSMDAKLLVQSEQIRPTMPLTESGTFTDVNRVSRRSMRLIASKVFEQEIQWN